MSAKRILGVLIVIVGAFIALSPQAGFWRGYPFWASMLILAVGTVIAAIGLDMARRKKGR